MFICNPEEKLAHIQAMETLKTGNRLRREERLQMWSQNIHQSDLLQTIRQQIRSEKFTHTKPAMVQNTRTPANYFSPHRIAVYTCILGRYDPLTVPACKPDNIDYFLISDSPPPSESIWKVLPACFEKVSDLTLVEQNRWFKMHPHLLFPDHAYSIYLDGNITPISDLTEFIHLIGRTGIATHRHYYRTCAFQEAEAVLKRGKDTKERIEQHLSFLTEKQFPSGYGLADCSIIARRNLDPFCIHLMTEWWNEFLAHSRRDQISFPYVLFKNGIQVDEVTTLGENRMQNDALYLSNHFPKT